MGLIYKQNVISFRSVEASPSMSWHVLGIPGPTMRNMFKVCDISLSLFCSDRSKSERFQKKKFFTMIHRNSTLSFQS